ncbi:TIGR04372 family glycosyltransferase [Nisaea sediminum]|uniref:TIGR04372 family glycosyltransferase n=1 Tax=Nisaea sediminum TaxID=2775867 RepID=UPI001865C7F6|nr:TIGR04372 family glycosyltransferase [Nisaea sediminum]
MAESQSINRLGATQLRRIFDPERVARLIQIVGPHLVGGRRCVLHIMPLAWRIGHIAMEPHALWELYGESHDRMVLLFPDSRVAPHSLGMRAVIDPYFRIQETDEPGIMIMGHVDAGILEQQNLTWFQRGPSGLLDNYIKRLIETGARPRHFEVPPQVRDAARDFCASRGMTDSDRLVVLNVRDRNFLADQEMHFYRTADISTYVPAIRHLLDKGYWVMRLGVDGSVPGPIDDPRYVEVWREPDYTTLLDPGLIARACFGITCSSGPEAVFRVLGIPQIIVNCILQCEMWTNPGDRLLFKSYRTVEDGKPARLTAMLEGGVALHADAEAVKQCGFVVEDNSAAEILASVEEMDALVGVAETATPSCDAGRFLEIGREYQLFLDETGHPRDARSLTAALTQFAYALPWTRLSVANQSANPDFLE